MNSIPFSKAPYTKVGEDRRRPQYVKGARWGGRPFSKGTIDLMLGETLLLPHGTDMSSIRTVLGNHGFRLHVRTDPDGIVAWAEKKNNGA